MKRAIFDIVLFISIFILPWWITAILALAGMFIFVNFYEFIVASIVVYALYAVPNSRIITSTIWFPLIIVSLYAGVQALRHYIILYRS